MKLHLKALWRTVAILVALYGGIWAIVLTRGLALLAVPVGIIYYGIYTDLRDKERGWS